MWIWILKNSPGYIRGYVDLRHVSMPYSIHKSMYGLKSQLSFLISQSSTDMSL